MKFYDSLWSYASINELLNVIIASICSSILYFILCLLIPVHPPMKTSNNNKYKNIVLIGGWTGMSKHKIQYKIDEIYVALPSIDDKETSKILNISKETKCKKKITWYVSILER